MDPTFSWSLLPELPWTTTLFIACIVVLWAYFFFFRFTPVVVANAPAVLTSLGIFGTFVGVAWGLSGFDVGDVEGSIPALLDGLKSSFWSSIVGIGGAVLLKLKHLVKARRADKDEAAYQSATIDDLAGLLRELNRALVGDEQSTALSRLELTGQGANERLDALKRSLDEFLANMAESNSRALVDALHEVIRDFNVKLNEQFGENFKRLNEAVERILIWQDRYTKQTAEVIEQQADAAERITTTSSSFQLLAENAEAFSGMTEQLGDLLSELGRQKEQAQDATASLVDIANYCRAWNLIAPTTPGQSVDGKPSEWRKDRARPAAASVRDA
jgi:hypothetical protein